MASFALVTLSVLFAIVGVILVTTPGFVTLIKASVKLPLLLGGIRKFYAEYQEFKAQEVPDVTPLEEYDFVILGAGSAGSALAARLSEVRDVSVLLVEAGGHEDLMMGVPLMNLASKYWKWDVLWEYMSEPSDDYCRAYENNQCRCYQGRVMGGSSVVNAMLAVKGNRHDYDEWANVTGDEGWSYENMMKFFKKLENFDVTLTKVDRSLHGFSGPVSITNTHHSQLSDAFIKAGEELGFPHVDYNGRDQKGFAYIQTNLKDGVRMSTNRAYLHPIRNRKNLHVSVNSHVNKVLIDPLSKTANGVEFVKDDKVIRVLAKKEIILSAGGVASPKILMLSGIGPTEHLESFGIKVLKALPVGENLMDHASYGGLTFLVNETVGVMPKEFMDFRSTVFNDFFHNRTGPLTIPGGIEALGFLDVNKKDLQSETPNIEFMFGPVSFLSGGVYPKLFGIRSDYFNKFFASNIYKHAWTIWPILLRPKSRGRVLLRSGDPKDVPRLQMNYFSDPDDVRVLIKGIRAAIKLSQTQAMQRFESTLMDISVPGCENHIPDSDQYWECALRTQTITIWHYSGTCKMGREDDPTAVVNSKLQVKGIKRLRVADTSIMPNIISGHTNIPAIAIGEKCADIIKEHYGYPR